ncbi:MAG: MATE family efflux transporter [Oscillospiraceae bacterium]|jgi:putative MATE family efflux protein|nr:MATE family efflux transporter [Oscillospiraceae bacterium]
MTKTKQKSGFLKSLFGAQDMTVGSPLRSMLLFSVPLLVGNIAQLLYNTVDSIVVGQFGGANQLAAIGLSMPVQMMFAVFFMTVGTGVSVMVSQYFGAKDRENLEKTVGNSLILILGATLFSSILGLALSRWILDITNCPPEVFDSALAYLRIMFLGFVGMGFYNILGGILRGFGDAMFPLFVLFGTTVLNIVLDLWFVAPADKFFGIGLDMGVAGAAWATIIAQTLSAVVCLLRLLHMKHILSINRSTMKLDGRICKQIVRIGVPSGLQQMIMSMSFVFVQSIINSILIPFGTDVVTGVTLFDGAMFVAVNTAVMRIDGFAMMPAQTFNQAAGTFTGQNIGAGKLERVSKGLRICLVMALSVTLIVFFAIWFGGRGLMKMFINDTRGTVISAAVSDAAARDRAAADGFGSLEAYLEDNGVTTTEAFASTDAGKTVIGDFAKSLGFADSAALILSEEGGAIAADFVRSKGFADVDDYLTRRIDKIIEVGFEMQRIMVWGYFLMAIANTIGGVMRGAGDTMAQLFIMISTNIVIRIPLTVLMVNWSKSADYPNGRPSMLFWSMLIAFGLNVIVSSIYFSTGKWKNKGVVSRPAAESAE